MTTPGGRLCDVADAAGAARAGHAAARSGTATGSAAAAPSAAPPSSPGRASTARQPCTYGFGRCQRTDTRPYAIGGRWRCPDHAPALLTGRPDPGSGRYCLAICYCGQCPHRHPPVLAPNRRTITELRNIANGKSRAGVTLTKFRDAQAATRRSA
jgi:hypothetical protein